MMSETIQDFLAEYQEDAQMKKIFKLVWKKYTKKMLETQERIVEKTQAQLMEFAKLHFQEIFAERMLRLTENRHENSVRIPTRNARRCGYCGQWFSTTLENFETHVAGHGMQAPLSPPPPPKPKPAKPFKCNIVGCNKRFTTRAHLKRHGVIHTGVKPFQCKVCKKRFTQKGNLRSHEPIHSGVKPFRCGICKQKFSQSNNLNVYLRIHSGVRPFKCRHCSMRFNNSSNLTTHLRLHTGSKPYACKECDKKFTTSGDLTKHCRVHNGEKPLQLRPV